MVLEVMPALGLALQRVCLPRGAEPKSWIDMRYAILSGEPRPSVGVLTRCPCQYLCISDLGGLGGVFFTLHPLQPFLDLGTRHRSHPMMDKNGKRWEVGAPSERTAFTCRLTLLLWNHCLITLAIAQQLLMP